MPNEKEPKNIFEHASSIFGGKKQKKKPSFTMEDMKKMIISLIVFISIGFVIGTMIDILLETNAFGLLLALFFVLLWLLKKFGKYLKD